MEKIREILILDPEPGIDAKLQGLLGKAGLENPVFIQSKNYVSLSELENPVNPDIIFISTKAVSGNVMIYFREHFPSAPAIMMGESGDEDLSVIAARAGAQDFIVKGQFQANSLIKSIQSSLARKRGQMNLTESNLRYELANRATNEIIWDADLQTGVKYLSDRKEIFGYPIAISRQKDWWESHIHPEDSHRVLFNLEKHISSGLDNWSDFYRFQGADGTYRYIHDRGYMMRDSQGLPVRMIGTMSDVTFETILKQREEAEMSSRHRKELQTILDIAEKDKQVTGEVLHDTLLQLLAAVKMMNMSVHTSMDQKDERMIKSLEMIDESIRQTRLLSSNLRPLSIHEWGLYESLEMMVAALKEERDIDFVIVIPETVLLKIPESKQVTLFFIAREQVKNILQHADATQVYIILDEKSDEFHFSISDNGKGFDTAGLVYGNGFKMMKLRIDLIDGLFLLESSPLKGCTVRLTLFPDPENS